MKIFWITIVFSFLACTKVDFTTKDSTSSQQVESPLPAPVAQPTPVISLPQPTATPVKCVDTIEQTTDNLRIIFMVDNSGSTLDTDLNQIIRAQTIENFLTKYGAKTNFSYSFGFFDDDTYVFNIANQKFVNATRKGLPPNVFGDSGDLAQALRLFSKVRGFGGTNYGQAVDAVKDMINQDHKSKISWNYVLVFMSDGQPSDISAPVAEHLKSMIELVMNAAVKRSALATASMVLFDPAEDAQYASSKRNLSAMAEQGKGQFFDTNFPPAGGLAIDDIISVPGKKCD